MGEPQRETSHESHGDANVVSRPSMLRHNGNILRRFLARGQRVVLEPPKKLVGNCVNQLQRSVCDTYT